MKKVSIIVPVYNSEKWLDDCIISIINQTYTNLEIILIDDGSSDNSFNICKKYASKDNRIITFTRHNKGECYTRCEALKILTGDYFYLMDCDDILVNDAIEQLVKYCIKYDLDSVNFNAEVFYDGINENNSGIKKNRHLKKYIINKSLNGFEYFKKCISNNDYSCALWSYFFKSTILKDKESLLFMKSKFNTLKYASAHSDMLICFEFLYRCKNVRQYEKIFYKRRVRENSIMTSKKSIRNVYSIYKVIEELNKYNINDLIFNKYKDNLNTTLFDIYSKLNINEIHNTHIKDNKFYEYLKK